MIFAEYALEIIVNDRARPACTPATVCAPELMFKRLACLADSAFPPTQAGDIWSLACTIFELVFGTRLFPFPLPNTLLARMATLCGEVPQEWTVNLLSREQLNGLCE
jgi:serine/threonine-protein kinase SRPK3